MTGTLGHYGIVEQYVGRQTLPKYAVPSRRRLKRSPTKIPATLVVDPEGEREKHPCRMVDISQAGLRLEANVGLKLGQVVEVVPSEGARHAVRCCVVWVGKPGSHQEGESGLQILGPLPRQL